MRVSASLTSLLFVLLLAACGPFIAEYNLDAYKNATSLKAETLALVDKSGEAYSKRQKDVEALTVKIDAAYEFAAGAPYNQLSAQQWQLLRDPDGSLYGAYVKYWKNNGAVQSAVFRADVKKLLGDAFDEIICLEANKQSLKTCSKPADSDGKKDGAGSGGTEQAGNKDKGKKSGGTK